MPRIDRLTWPETFRERWFMALVLNLVLVVTVSLLLGLLLGPGVLGMTAVLILAAAVLAPLTAAIARPGESVWKPFLRSR